MEYSGGWWSVVEGGVVQCSIVECGGVECSIVECGGV